MTIRATWNNVLLAESDRTVLVEGNHYFPIEDASTELFEESLTHTHCPWKGEASYYTVVTDGKRNEDAVWYYPEPFDAAAPIKGYVAFWRGVEVDGTNANEPEVRPPGR
jgi:uncharacterized protein (DUF427 family)